MGMTFAQFVASRRRSEKICEEIGFDDGQPERGGFIYGEVEAYIEDAWPDAGAKYCLTLERSQWVSDDLDRLEHLLWAEHYVWEAQHQLAGDDVGQWLIGHCDFTGIKMDGDLFGQLFSDPGPYDARRAANMVREHAGFLDV